MGPADNLEPHWQPDGECIKRRNSDNLEHGQNKVEPEQKSVNRPPGLHHNNDRRPRARHRLHQVRLRGILQNHPER